jgi:hypothetical protein
VGRCAPVHSVHVYADDHDLITRLCAISAASLRVGDSVLLIATPEHRQQLLRCLWQQGIEIRSHAREGRFTMFDAEQTLTVFMSDGMPDRERFSTNIGRMLADARVASRSQDGGLTVFGEMVSVLWEQANQRGALELEALWNTTLNECAFHLHCAYPRSGFAHGGLDAVLNAHTHVRYDSDQIAA